MHVVRIEDHELAGVAELMSRIKPEWWSKESAMIQLENCLTWAVADPQCGLTAWIACHDLPGYRTLEIDTMGSDIDGTMVIGPALDPVLQACLSWARSKGYAIIRYTRSSSNLSCDGRALGSIADEMSCLQGSQEAASYQWMINSGFEPAGLLPDVYGQGTHGVLIIYRISQS